MVSGRMRLRFPPIIVRWVALRPTPQTLQPTHCTPHPTPYALHPTPNPYALHITHYTVRPTPYALHPTHYTFHPAPCALHPTPYTLSRSQYDIHPEPQIIHPPPSALNTQPFLDAGHSDFISMSVLKNNTRTFTTSHLSGVPTVCCIVSFTRDWCVWAQSNCRCMRG